MNEAVEWQPENRFWKILNMKLSEIRESENAKTTPNGKLFSCKEDWVCARCTIWTFWRKSWVTATTRIMVCLQNNAHTLQSSPISVVYEKTSPMLLLLSFPKHELHTDLAKIFYNPAVIIVDESFTIYRGLLKVFDVMLKDPLCDSDSGSKLMFGEIWMLHADD